MHLPNQLQLPEVDYYADRKTREQQLEARAIAATQLFLRMAWGRRERQAAAGVTARRAFRRDECHGCGCKIGAGRAGRLCKDCRPSEAA